MQEKVTYIDIHGNEILDYEYQKQKYGTIENEENEVSKQPIMPQTQTSARQQAVTSAKWDTSNVTEASNVREEINY